MVLSQLRPDESGAVEDETDGVILGFCQPFRWWDPGRKQRRVRSRQPGQFRETASNGRLQHVPTLS